MINRNIFTGKLELDKTERFNFGKHKGKLIATVSVTDPEYLKWLAENDSKYHISDTWRQYCEDLAYTSSNVQYATYCRN